MSQHFKPILLLAFVLLALTLDASAQTKPTAPDKEKADKERAERFKKVAAPLLAEAEQRRAIIRDLVDTCAKCRALGEAYIDAVGDAAKDERISRERDQCHAVLEAKLARTPLDTLAPFTQVMKGADVEWAKWAAIQTICDAYEYGMERAKSGATGRK
jgi:hypothetical protein